LVQARGLDRARDLRRRRAQRFHLAPIGTPLERPVVAHLKDSARAPALVGTEWQEDPDEVLVAALLENLARESERRAVVARSVFLAYHAGQHVAEDRAVRAHHRHLGPSRWNGNAARDDV